MKVAIVTIVDYINYGNRLQNYAVQEILHDLNCDVETLVAISHKRRLLNAIKLMMIKVMPRILFKKRPYIRRERSFISFTQKHIHERKINTIGGQIPKSIADEFDYFLVGSDQIWNPQFLDLDIPNGGYANRFLRFAAPEQRVAIAPSIGVDTIPETMQAIYREGLNDFRALSVREYAGADIIRKLTGKEATVLIDPTLMLDAKQWNKIAKPAPIDRNKPYILKYVLAEQSDHYQASIQQLADENGMVVHEMMSTKQPELFDVAPDAFIDLIANASLVCTDSFHATVFSILFGKPFLLKERDDKGGLDSMNSRLNTLLVKLGLEDRLPGRVEQDAIFAHDYNSAYQKLEEEREQFRAYLEKAFS